MSLPLQALFGIYSDGHFGAPIQGATLLVAASVDVEGSRRQPPRHWTGDVDPQWQHGAYHGPTFDQTGQPLRVRDASASYYREPGTWLEADELCSCDDTSHRDLWSWSSAVEQREYIGGHIHKYRIVCPACYWYAPVASAGAYAIPIHGGMSNRCAGTYEVVQSELFAHPIPKPAAPFDATPTQWRIHNGWTGKYVADPQGNENSDLDRAHGFPSEAAAVAFVQSARDIPIAAAYTAPQQVLDRPICAFCEEDYFPHGTDTCWRCEGPLTSTIGWCHIWPCNAKGQVVGSGTTLPTSLNVSPLPRHTEMVLGVYANTARRLREGVAKAELDPTQVVDATLRNGNAIAANRPVVCTLPKTLFGERRWIEFVDALLPDAPQEFRQECVRILNEDIEETTDEAGDDVDEDSDEDD